jgi:predicted phage baseplate assembly protein
VTGVSVESLGGLVPASHATTIHGEVLGQSDGTPGQTFPVRMLPLLPRREGEWVEVEEVDGDFEPWVEVSRFGESEPASPHYVIDDVAGTVEFGPRIRSQSGEEQQFGVVPPVGRTIRFSSYRTGGGILGNVGARTLTVLKSSIPYIASVTNSAPATGGLDTEELEHAKWRGPQGLRGRHRAVTSDDFEVLAREASPAVARARGIVASNPADKTRAPGMVRLLLVPAAPALGPLSPEALQVSARVRQDVQVYLDERRLLTSEVLLESPTYTWVSVAARVRVRRRSDRARTEQTALETLYRYIHPAVGGPDGRGWPFGRELFVGEIYALLQQVPGIDTVEEVTLQQYEPVSGAYGKPTNRLAVDPNGLICSHEHKVNVG